MTDILTESFCERCGTKYTFEGGTDASGPVRRARTLVRGLRYYLLSDDPLDESLAEARRDDERDSAGRQLDAFHRTFSFCIECRQYVCHDCWNEDASRCLTCAPMPGRVDVLDLEVDLSGRLGGGGPAVGADGEEAAGSAWPSADLVATGNEVDGRAEASSRAPAEVATPVESAAEQPPPATEPVAAAEQGAAEGPVAATERVAGVEPVAPLEPVVPGEPVSAVERGVAPEHVEPTPPLSEAVETAPPVGEPVEALRPPEAGPEVAAPVQPDLAAAAPAPTSEVTPAPASPSPQPPAPASPPPAATPTVPPPTPATAPVWQIVAPDEGPAAGQPPAWSPQRAAFHVPGQRRAADAGRPGQPPLEAAGRIPPQADTPDRSAAPPVWAAAPDAGPDPRAGAWDATARGVLDRPSGSVQACVSCGLPLSATARFCRRCGARQG